MTVQGFRHSGKRGWFDDLLVRIMNTEDVVEFVVLAFQRFVEQGSLAEVSHSSRSAAAEYPR